jgi:MOSC domain-containing protein YiiM
MSKIEFINITSISDNKTSYINQAFLEKNKGIVNDRYYNCYKDKKEQVTLINLEEIDAFNKNNGKNVAYKDFRRNIIVSGINLNKYINKKIIIQNVVLKIHELCQPCNYLQKKLGISNLVKKLINKSGVRAEIISSGFISVGNKIKIY